MTNPTLKTRRISETRERRRGAAVVEFAVILPLLIALLLGVIEYGWLFMVRQTLQNAAREGCRQKVLQTSEAPYTEVQERVDAVVAPMGIGGYTTTMATNGCQESVTVTVPQSSVSLAGGFFGTSTSDLIGTCTMRKEGCTPGG
jgi:Flp pilus assembly protein TadG